MHYACVSTEAFIVAIIYIRRLIRRTHTFFVNRGTIHRILLAAVLVASKYIDDNPVSMRDMAYIGIVHSADLMAIELEFLRILQYRLLVEWDEYEGYLVLCEGTGIYLTTADDEK